MSNKYINHIINSNIQKYNTSKSKYNIMKINTIIFNKKTHYVSSFKDYLIWNDITEFLQIYFTTKVIKVFFKRYFKPKAIFYSLCYINKKISKIMCLNKNLNENMIKIKNENENEKLKIEFSNILNSLSNNDTHFSIINNSQITETTIDNIGVNDDITQSFDLNFNEIDKEIEFINGNNINDKTIESLMNIMKEKQNKNKNDEKKIIKKKKNDNLILLSKDFESNLKSKKKLNEENTYLKKFYIKDAKLSANNSIEKNLNTWTLKRKKINIEINKEFNKTLKKPTISKNSNHQTTICDIKLPNNFFLKNEDKRKSQCRNQKIVKIHPLKLQFEFELSQPKDTFFSNRNFNINSQMTLKMSNKSLNSNTTNETKNININNNFINHLNNNKNNIEPYNKKNEINCMQKSTSKNQKINNKSKNKNNLSSKDHINHKYEYKNDKLLTSRNQITSLKKNYTNKNKLIIKLTNGKKNKIKIKEFEDSIYLENINN